MSSVLIIGAGGVGQVAAHKCVQQNSVFSQVCLASRSLEKCRKIQQEVSGPLQIAALDAGNPEEVLLAIEKYQAEIVINAVLPYHNLLLMDACLEAGVHYIDTAVQEKQGENTFEPDDANWYGPQWRFHERFKQKGLTAILGAGSDPGLVNAFCAYSAKHFFDSIQTIDILDVNAGDHGFPFATNFNPEINLREVQNPAYFWENGQWCSAKPLSVEMDFLFPQIGLQKLYLMDHDELHSLIRNFSDAEYIKFWMGFSPEYITHVKRLREIGMLSVEPIQIATEDGTIQQVVPLRLLKELLPDPAALGANYTGTVCIGCSIRGRKHGKDKKVFIYSSCDHKRAYADTGAQAIYWAAGIPAAAAAILLSQGVWRKPGVHNIEQCDPDPFLGKLPDLGLNWHVEVE